MGPHCALGGVPSKLSEIFNPVSTEFYDVEHDVSVAVASKHVFTLRLGADMSAETVGSRAGKRQVFLLAEPKRLACKKCGATMHFHDYAIPLSEFVADVIAFYESHKRCDEKN